MTKSAYRPDIDGLRALAVLAVLFYHLDFWWMPGGFVGVDVFFVISGYLITNLIVSEVEQEGSFSYGNFYLRRIRRLGPALMFTALLCCVFSFLLLSPEHLASFGGSVVAAALSVSNFYFWNESGYFDAAANVKPLLHTWSLSVEEQFYIVWPVLLVTMLRFRSWAPPAFIAVAGIVSLFAAQYWLKIDKSAAFYLMPFRVVEFAIGAAMVWLGRYEVSERTKEMLALAGMILVVVPMFAYNDRHTPFPGLSVIPPCVGTALLIHAGTARSAGRVFANRATVFVGRISYSLYLIHWPLIVFYRYYKFGPLTVVEQISIAVVSVALATLMFWYVEQPFRRSVKRVWSVPARRLASFVGGLATMSVVFGAFSQTAAGWPQRLPGMSADLQESVAKLGRSSFSVVPPDKADVLLIGDSHADHFTEAVLIAANSAGLAMARSNAPGCPPLFEVSPEVPVSALDETERKCLLQEKKWEDEALAFKGEFIVLAARWDYLSEPARYGPGNKYRAKQFWMFIDRKESLYEARLRLSRALAATVAKLTAAGKRVVLMGQVPPTAVDLSTCYNAAPYLIADIDARCASPSKADMLSRVRFANDTLRELQKRDPDHVFAYIASDYLCGGSECTKTIGGTLIYRNEDHITVPASAYIGWHLTQSLQQFLRHGTPRVSG